MKGIKLWHVAAALLAIDIVGAYSRESEGGVSPLFGIAWYQVIENFSAKLTGRAPRMLR